MHYFLEVRIIAHIGQGPGQLHVMGGHETQGTGASQVAQHRLAGGQALVGIGPPQDLVHKAEELLARVRTLQNAPQAAQLGNKITPVSYTHLDVYKRQA